MNRATLALLATTALTVSAAAADLPARSVAPVAPVASVAQISFSGVYVGLSGGWGQGTFKSDGNDKITANGGLIGLTVGFNHQYSNKVVVGVEGDVSWSGMKKTITMTAPNMGGTTISRVTGEQSLLATFRPRLGYAIGNWMPYLTGGLAVTNSKLGFKDDDYSAGGILIASMSGSASKTRVGWTVGGGVEVLLTARISAKAEYLYADFGKTRYTFNGMQSDKIALRDHIIRAGLNYKF